MVTISNEKQESRISGTYIRTLVKQLASSRTKDSDSAMNPREKTTENSKKSTGKTHMQPQAQTQKKQVRRRLHTSRPYQERLLNMAEARREIVTALKQHRAAMKQRQRQQSQTQTQTLLLTDGESRPRPNSECVMDPFPYCVHPPPPPQPPDPFPWQIPTTNPPLNFVLPNQPLGLNLNFQDFNDIIQTSPSSSSSISTNNSNSVSINNNPPITSPPSSSPPLPSSSSTSAVAGGGGGAGFHQTVDEEEMARMRSIGEKHQIEWNDTVNLVTSAWWFEFMKTVEPPEMKPEIDDDVCRPFGDVMEFPSWLNPTEEPYLSDYSSPDDPALSCMEIGEIEGMDGDWLA